MALNWSLVEERVADADSIAFDGCHKIYVLMDAHQTALMKEYGYEKDGAQMRVASERTKGELLGALREWYDDSCGLRFINAVRTVEGNPNDGFETLIGQFDDEDDDDVECEHCGDYACDGECQDDDLEDEDDD